MRSRATLDSLQVGDVIYHISSTQIDRWTVEMLPRKDYVERVWCKRSDGGEATITRDYWHTVVIEGHVIIHKDLVETFGEEVMFEHTLADSIDVLVLEFRARR